jgi:hypothetical protein
MTPMTEDRWLTTEDSSQMVQYVQTTATLRKLRLFVVGCARLIWDRISISDWKRSVEVSELYADGLSSPQELEAAALWKYFQVSTDPEIQRVHQLIRTFGSLEGVLFGICTTATTTDIGLRSLTTRAGWRGGLSLTGKQQPQLFRHIIGNPFRAYKAPPSWPSTVVQLAASLYQGQDCRLPLSDALEESGHQELAEHFRAESWHPKGCWVMDLILGKE